MKTLRNILSAVAVIAIFAFAYQTVTTVTFPAPAVTSFGLQRVAEPYSIADLRTHDKRPEFWDEQLINGGTSVFNDVSASTVLTTDSVTEAVVRQTFMRFPYQTGKSQLIYFTGIMEPETGTIKRYGYYNTGFNTPFTDSLDGVYFKTSNDTMYAVTAYNGTETTFAQHTWNLDKGTSIDWSKAQVFVIDFGWLGYKGVRFGTVQDGGAVYHHEVTHTNVQLVPFMTSPNHSVRGEIRQVSAGAGTNTLTLTCSSVQSEGGLEQIGVLRSYSTGGTHVDLALEDSTYIIFGLRITDSHRDVAVDLSEVDMLITTASHQIMYEIWYNSNISGTLSYTSNGGCVDVAVGNGTQYILPGGGYCISTGFVSSSGNQGGGSGGGSKGLLNAVRLGISTAGVYDKIYVAATPIAGSTAVDIEASIGIREY